MTEKVTKLALWSRLIVLILQLLSNATLPDHKPDAFRSPEVINVVGDQSVAAVTPTWLDKTVNYCFGGLRHWDGEYFLHIAEHGYSYENTLAFYPLWPAIVRTFALGFQFCFGLGLSLHSWILIAAVILNIFCFCKAATVLYALTQHLFNDPNKSWNAVLLFCFNPASIFFTAAYSEALFCWMSFYLMLECVLGMRLLPTTSALAFSIISRSNGLVNAGFPIYFLIRKFLLKSGHGCLLIMKTLLTLFFALVPLQFFYFYAFQQFCLEEKDVEHAPEVISYALKRDYILAGPRQPHNSPWCDKTFPYPYSYVQSHYWNVGFLRYYQIKQLPNFILAAPVLTFLFYHCYKYLKHCITVLLPNSTVLLILKKYKPLPFVLHALFLTIVCIFFVHIQVSTRLICSATPVLYWFAADHLPKTFDQVQMRSKAGAIIMWFGSYYVLGTLLFSNNLPWT